MAIILFSTGNPLAAASAFHRAIFTIPIAFVLNRVVVKDDIAAICARGGAVDAVIDVFTINGDGIEIVIIDDTATVGTNNLLLIHSAFLLNNIVGGVGGLGSGGYGVGAHSYFLLNNVVGSAGGGLVGHS
jgi:hypothetical protein